MEDININESKSEKKNLRDVLNSIDKAGAVASKVFSIGVLAGAITFCIATSLGKSIKVQEGSNLYQIAKQYGISQSELVKRNKLENPDYIQAGQDLILYDKGASGVFQKVSDIVDKYWF